MEEGGRINNPAGNLALHIIGRLNYLVGTLLGGTGYVRDREKEFSARDVLREQLITGFDELAVMVHRVLSGLSADEFGADYQIKPPSQSVRARP